MNQPFLRPLGRTGLQVSALGLGTVKLGRNEGVKYPSSFTLPDDRQAQHLLDCAREAGINLLDTAPAYGNSEERLGKLLHCREDWVIATKTGEEFRNGKSEFNFTSTHTRLSVERSLKRLHTDYLDLVLIHSDGNDKHILEQSDCVEALRRCQEEGLVRAIGMSTKTIEGGLLACEYLDAVMITWNLEQQDREVLERATKNGLGIFIKKALMSGHASVPGRDLRRESFTSALSQAGVSSIIVGTLNPEHLRQNVQLAKDILAEQG